jgi:hypothetical protein
LHLLGDYVGHALAISIANTKSPFPNPQNFIIKSLHEQPNALSSVVHEYMHNVIFKVQVFEVETSFE